MLLTHAADPVVWLRLVRCVLFVVAAVVMFAEPMSCGGRNTTFHRIVSGFFLVSAYHSIELAKARATVLMVNPKALADIPLSLSESVITLALFVVIGRLFYEAFKWRQLNKIKPQRRDTCRFTP